MTGAPQQAELLVTNGLVVTVDAERRILTDGAIAVGGGRILAVGPNAEVASAWQAPETIDARDHLVLPGLVDSHTHLTQGQRGMVPDEVGAMEFLMRWSLPMFVALSPEEEHLFARLICAEHLKTGTTTVAEGGSVKHLDAVVAAIEEVGLRANLGRLTWDNPMLWEQMNPRLAAAKMDTDEALSAAADAVDRWSGALDGKISMWVHMVGGGSATPQLQRDAKAFADQRGIGVSQHEASDEGYAQRIFKMSGRRPVELLAELGVLGPNQRLVHANSLSEDEVRLIVESETKIVSAPTGAWKLALGMAATGKVPELLDAGALVCLASDSCNSSNTSDMVRIMQIAAGVWRDIRQDPSAVTVTEAIEMATLNGAKSLLMEDEIGSIEVGKKADLALFDTRRLEWAPMIDPLANLVFSATGQSVDTVLVDGRVVLRDGEILGIDEEALIAELAAIDWAERIDHWTGLRRPPSPWPLV
jgi:5-methylthioadenosine/S-adenosylhomocysteine deaminase